MERKCTGCGLCLEACPASALGLTARLPDPDDAGRLWRSVAIGDLAEVVVLDARLGGRDVQPDSDGADDDIDDPDRSILSPEQWAWARERIQDTTRPWVVVTSQVPVSEMLLPMPEGLEGTSLAPVLETPDRPWKSAAFSQYPRPIPGKGRAMGYAMRTDRYRFVAWTLADGTVDAYELYDHQADPLEDLNLAADPANAELVEQLSGQLRAGWQAARPAG